MDAVDWFPFDNRLEMDCDMGAGSSGGPMFTPSWQLVGANSHHDVDDNNQRVNDNLYSSEHGSEAVKVIDAINEEGCPPPTQALARTRELRLPRLDGLLPRLRHRAVRLR
ncbi:hypothetical protein [Streptomyces sp. MZ04]|uniref:hypothetical protein n=1 Tax=Streptomyces sp. MZ04 TaxID=2559236 RepID=UPI00107E8532|nr:hypothetical protein [Streptomyces sp. MZ04]TGA96249.1 hypothetical protein E2651_32635 [Streptomyces sp. MZ04]